MFGRVEHPEVSFREAGREKQGEGVPQRREKM